MSAIIQLHRNAPCKHRNRGPRSLILANAMMHRAHLNPKTERNGGGRSATERSAYGSPRCPIAAIACGPCRKIERSRVSSPAAEEFRRTRCARRPAIGAEPARSRSGTRGRTERAEARSVGRREAERERLAYCWLVEPDLEGGGGGIWTGGVGEMARERSGCFARERRWEKEWQEKPRADNASGVSR